MNRLSLLVDDFFDLLLRDASVRVGLDSMKTKPTEWVMLMNGEVCNDDQCRQRLKTVAYVVHYLLNVKELMNSFSDYFEHKMKIPFRKPLLVQTRMVKRSLSLKFTRRSLLSSRPILYICHVIGTR